MRGVACWGALERGPRAPQKNNGASRLDGVDRSEWQLHACAPSSDARLGHREEGLFYAHHHQPDLGSWNWPSLLYKSRSQSTHPTCQIILALFLLVFFFTKPDFADKRLKDFHPL